MINAMRFDSRITIGGVPNQEDLQQLKEIGYKTLVDVRDNDEKFGGYVEKRAKEMGLIYRSIPISREGITISHMMQFFNTIYERESAPLYCFSRFGKRPLAFLLLFEAVATKKPLVFIFQKAAKFGLNLDGDLTLHAFLVDFYNNQTMEPVLAKIKELRPDLLKSE
jgi:protein tyrosine phosphatase (PTP) superfamily phosphohydrolase (DUF442 family)